MEYSSALLLVVNNWYSVVIAIFYCKFPCLSQHRFGFQMQNIDVDAPRILPSDNGIGAERFLEPIEMQNSSTVA